MSSFVTSITTARKKTPEQLVRLALRALSDLLESGDISVPSQVHDDLCKRLSQIKILLYGDGDSHEVDEEKAIEISKTIQEVGQMII